MGENLFDDDDDALDPTRQSSKLASTARGTCNM